MGRPILYPGGLVVDVFFGFQVDGPITEGRAYKLRGRISNSLQ